MSFVYPCVSVYLHDDSTYNQAGATKLDTVVDHGLPFWGQKVKAQGHRIRNVMISFGIQGIPAWLYVLDEIQKKISVPLHHTVW